MRKYVYILVLPFLFLQGCMTPEQIAAQNAANAAAEQQARENFQRELEATCKEKGLKPKTKKFNECLVTTQQQVAQQYAENAYRTRQNQLLRQADNSNQLLMQDSNQGITGYLSTDRNNALLELKRNAMQAGDSEGYKYAQQLQMQYQQQDLQRQQLDLQRQQMQRPIIMQNDSNQRVRCQPNGIGGVDCRQF